MYKNLKLIVKAVLQIRDVYQDSDFFHSGSRIQQQKREEKLLVLPNYRYFCGPKFHKIENH